MNAKVCLVCVFILLCFSSGSQTTSKKEFQILDTSIFQDASNHWYSILDNEAVIHPRPGHPRYKATELTAVADNILLYQKDNGGWPKNYDMFAILTPEQKDSVVKAKHTLNTTFDNRTSYSHVGALAKVFYVTHEAKYKDAALKGIGFILSAQYANGGWPQYFPLEKNYSTHITYNDDAFSGIMWMLKDIIENKPQYDFIDKQELQRVTIAFNKGLDCILKTQINDAGKPTAWCQQYDEITMQPAWARAFEPPSICNGESVSVVLLLMSIKSPTKQVVDAVQNAVAWFNESKITGIRVKTIDAPVMVTKYRVSKTDRVVVDDPQAPPIWTRYYELKTHRPLFCNRDSKVVYSLAEVDRERRDGYAWYTYEPQKVLDRYGEWRKVHGL